MPSVDKKVTDPKSIAKYVIQNIDKAIDSGWVKIYYQPVIRTLTGQLCGAESLSRWIDPEHGFLSPDLFIGALEATRQIHKLDCFVVEQVCSDISDRLKQGLDTVPVSVNFSRIDFELLDMLNFLEDTVSKYDIPKDYIHVEITESMIVSDSDLMSGVIKDFRNAGYEVWMDDFGSGYSSLTLLKDYNFDTLKLDMNFLSSFTDKSKSIVTSTITMAKDIGIMTLAEGVETQEQFEFLHSIGCGKLQGYFYGKPQPLDDFFDHIAEYGINIEPRQWRHYYQVASFNARFTDEPLEIIEDNGRDFKTLFMNNAYKNQIVNKEYSIEELDKLVYHTNSPLIKKYREFANILEASKNLETFYYTNNGSILCFQAQEIAEHAGKHLIKGSNRNISADINLQKQNSVDNKLKELNHLFDSITVINPEKNSVVPLVGRTIYIDDTDKNSMRLSTSLHQFVNSFVAMADREKVDDFLDFSTLKERIDKSGKGFVENIFRVKQPDGNYRWREVSVMLIPGTHGKEYLLAIKATADDAQEFLQNNNNIFNPKDYGISPDSEQFYSKLWINILADSNIKFFWKDNNRRFLGASKAFLDFLGCRIEDIMGKTSEEFGLVAENNSFIEDEISIISEGVSKPNLPIQVVLNGVFHNLIVSRSPLYINGTIVGLIGTFIDVDDELALLDEHFREKLLDPITGLMNVSALADATKDYAHHYASDGTDYALIILRNENHHRIVKDYGEEFGNKLLKRIGEVILDVTDGKCAIAKCIASDFAMITGSVKQSELDNLTGQLKTSLESIRELEGNSVTLNIHIGYRLRSEEGITDENIYSSVLDVLQAQK